MKTPFELQTEAALRRGARILALQSGKPIPHPELAELDARPGNVDDAAVLATLRGASPMPQPVAPGQSIPGASIFPPARLLASTATAANSAEIAEVHYADGRVEVLGIGGFVRRSTVPR